MPRSNPHDPTIPTTKQLLMTLAAWQVAVMHTLLRSHRKPVSISAIIIDQVISPNPHQLMTLMHIKLRHNWLIPPVPLLGATATPLHVINSRSRNRTLAGIDLEPFVGSYKWRVGPVSLDPSSLGGPVICIPYWAVNSHCLVLWVGYPSVL